MDRLKLIKCLKIFWKVSNYYLLKDKLPYFLNLTNKYSQYLLHISFLNMPMQHLLMHMDPLGSRVHVVGSVGNDFPVFKYVQSANLTSISIA